MRWVVGFLAILFLLVSAYFSFDSFTGYVVSDSINVRSNSWAVISFFVGILLAYKFIKKR